MFDDILVYLNGLTHKEKADLINNLKEFSRLKALLEAKDVLTRDEKTGELWIIKDHEFVDEFLQIFKKLTMQGVKLIDKRKGKNNLSVLPEQKKQ